MLIQSLWRIPFTRKIEEGKGIKCNFSVSKLKHNTKLKISYPQT
jgi:hypothetical protein